MRMHPQILPYITLNGIVHWDRQTESPIKRWSDGIKNDLNRLNIKANWPK